jgi:hypothetical protein
MRLPVHRLFNCIYTWCVERIDPEKREAWDMDLIAPLPWLKDRAPTESMIEAEGDLFMAALQAHEAGRG